MKRKNVIADHGEAASNFFPVRIVVVDSDKKSLKENVTILQKFPEIYEGNFVSSLLLNSFSSLFNYQFLFELDVIEPTVMVFHYVHFELNRGYIQMNFLFKYLS